MKTELAKTTTHLPAIQSSPWVPVIELPGMSNPRIAQLGLQLFSAFTRTPLLEVKVLSSQFGSATLEQVGRALASIKADGVVLHSTELTFASFPGYRAQVEIYEVDQYHFLVVKDFRGVYVYSYLAATSLLNVQRVLPAAPRLLN